MKSMKRAIRRRARARLLKRREVEARYIDLVSKYELWATRFPRGSSRYSPERCHQRYYRKLRADDGKARRERYRCGLDCPCGLGSPRNRRQCPGCIRRSRWQAGEPGMDFDYQEWLRPADMLTYWEEWCPWECYEFLDWV